jgi:hypothetical protein
MSEVDIGVKYGIRTIHVFDDEGNLIAIFQRIEEQE